MPCWIHNFTDKNGKNKFWDDYLTLQKEIQNKHNNNDDWDVTFFPLSFNFFWLLWHIKWIDESESTKLVAAHGVQYTRVSRSQCCFGICEDGIEILTCTCIFLQQKKGKKKNKLHCQIKKERPCALQRISQFVFLF